MFQWKNLHNLILPRDYSNDNLSNISFDFLGGVNAKKKPHKVQPDCYKSK